MTRLPAGASAGVLSERYKMVRLISQGQGIETHLAVDEATGQPVVIKTTDTAALSSEARIRLEHEGAVLRRLTHPRLATIVETGYVDDTLYVVRPFVAGVTLRERLADGALSLSDALTVAQAILEALCEVHTQGILHRDVKPANIIVDSGSPLQGATLIDFGLARSPALCAAVRDRPAGTARYMAPEQAGLIDRTVDERADLYSVGMVLFECLAGRPAFEGATVGEILREQLSTPPPPLRSLGVRVPGALEEVVQRLLRKDPDDRYQSAEAALADISVLADAVHRGVPEPELVVGARDRRRTLAEPPLIGREAELGRLDQLLDDARHGSGGFIAIEATSGGGKTRLLDEFCRRAAGSGAWVLRGQGIERSAPRPLQILAGVIADLVAATGAEPGLAVDLRGRLGPAAAAVSVVVPELRSALGTSGDSVPGSETYAPARGERALIALLDALGSGERPAVVILDDCQWADELTLRVLASWAEQRSRPDAPNRYVLVVVAARPEELGDEHPLRRVPERLRLALPSLTRDEIGQVVESMAGPVPSEATDVVAELSRGNPFMISAVLRGLVEVGALSSSGAGWRFAAGSADWQSSREAAAFLTRRLELLASSTRRLLEAGAVLGRQFDVDLAVALIGDDGLNARLAMRPALERNLVWQRDDAHYAFVHDRLRETLLGALDSTELARFHLRAAEEVEGGCPPGAERAFELAYHFDAAGEPGRALGYALESGQAARDRHDLELAERQYLIAERGLNGAPAGTRLAVAEALGEVLMLRGRYDEASERLETARSLATDDVTRARVLGHFGQLLFKRDDLEGAAEHIAGGLKVLGETVPGGRFSLALLLAREVFLRLVCRARRDPRRPTDAAAADRQRLAAHLFTQLQYPWWFHQRRMATLWLMLRQVNWAERYSDRSDLGHAYGVWGGALALTFPFFAQRGLRYVEQSEALYRQQGDPRGIGHALSMRACVLHAAGRFAEAAEAAGRALELLGQSGDPWEVGFAARNRAMCLYRLGRLREAVDEARRIYRSGIELGDAHAEATALEIWSKATSGHLPAERTHSALRHVGADLEVSTAVLQAEALRLRASGHLDKALATLENAAATVRRARPSSTYVVPVFPWLATLSREWAEEALLPGDRRRRLRRARRAARRALRYARRFRNDRPHARREMGLVAALAGHPRRARRHLDRSALEGRRLQALAEQAETHRQRERLIGPVNLPDADEGDAGPSALAAETLTPRATLGLAERFEALLEAGARLASAASSEDIAAAIRETAVSLLRAERCLVVGFGTDPHDESCDGLQSAPASRQLAERAMASRRVVVATEAIGAGEDVSDSLVLAGVRSALCAPIIVRDRVAGYFLVCHSLVGSLFGDEEERLAEFIARLAGAALEREQLQQEMRANVVSAQEAERARVARDLHDEIGQALTSVLLGVRLVESSVDASVLDGPLKPRLADLRDTVGGALASVQRLAFELRPTVLDDLGLVAALRRLVAGQATGHGVTFKLETVNIGPGDRLPPAIETTVYRIVQEALTNVVRHAGASLCSVVIARSDESLRVVIEDDGAGFEPGDATSQRFGLGGMTERAELVAGTLRLTSAPGEGTTIVFEVNLG